MLGWSHCPQSLGKSHGELQVTLTRPCLNVFRKLRDINFPLEIHSVISFPLDGHVLLKHLGCLEFLLVILSNPKAIVHDISVLLTQMLARVNQKAGWTTPCSDISGIIRWLQCPLNILSFPLPEMARWRGSWPVVTIEPQLPTVITAH